VHACPLECSHHGTFEPLAQGRKRSFGCGRTFGVPQAPMFDQAGSAPAQNQICGEHALEVGRELLVPLRRRA
jgi:hypothetical protein